MKKYFYIFLFILSCLGVNAQSTLSNIYVLENTKELTSIGKYVAFFEDKSGKMSFEEIQKQQGYISQNIETPNFNITTSAIWGRIKFTSKLQFSNWYMSIDPATYNEIVFYRQNNHGLWHKEYFGNGHPKEQRPLAVNHFFLKLDVNAGDTVLVYFKIQDYYPMQIDIKVGSIETFMIASHNSDLYNGICYGLMIMMLIYNLYLFITQKKIVYLFYLMYVFCSLVFSSYLSGYALHFPAPLLKLIQFAPIIPPAGFGIFGLLFTVTLFTEALSPRFKKIIYVFILTAFADVVLSAFRSFVHLSENIIQPLGLLLGILCISAAIIALRKKQSSAAYYLFGFGTYMFCLFYLILSAQGVFAATSFSWHALATGSAIESIMLSFALGDKVKVIMQEKEKAQKEVLAQALENARLVNEQNTLLEQKVKERTTEVVKQKELIEEKQKEIIDSIRYAKRIQESLLPTEKYIQRVLDSLKRKIE